MANRRFEIYQYHQVLTRMRLGESDRAIARSGLMGCEKASALREVAGREGWLEASTVMPDDAILAQVLDVPSSRPQSASSVLPYPGQGHGLVASGYPGYGHPPGVGGDLRIRYALP